MGKYNYENIGDMVLAPGRITALVYSIPQVRFEPSGTEVMFRVNDLRPVPVPGKPTVEDVLEAAVETIVSLRLKYEQPEMGLFVPKIRKNLLDRARQQAKERE